MHWRCSVALLLCGCAVSRARFEERSLTISQANERARHEAHRTLLAGEGLVDGYGPGLLEAFSVLCSREEERRQTEYLLSSGRLLVQPGEMERLCFNQSLVLDGMLERQPVKVQVLRAVDFARTRRGELVTYSLVPRVVGRASLLVDETCNRMPSSPLQQMDVIVVRATEAAVRHFEQPYDVQELEMTCTQYLD